METNFILFIIVGFAAQLIDGALGMAYGVSSNTFLLSIGIPPAVASASVHMAEVVTTGVSGFSHWRLGNVDMNLVKRLVLPGVLGGVTGAYLLTSFDGKSLTPYISGYLLVMGGVMLFKAIRFNPQPHSGVHTSRVSLLAVVGGFFDAIGGGGWGPIVTTTLVARGKDTRLTIGSVNFSEFFVTLTQSIVFVLSLSFLQYWQVVLGLIIGGVIAAPLGAQLTRRLPVKTLMIVVGILIILLSLRTILLVVF